MFVQWMGAMRPLILTGWMIPEFAKSEFADLAVDFIFRFVWGELPSPDELATYLGPGTPESNPGVTGRTLPEGGARAKTGVAMISAWLNSVSTTRPSNYGSTYNLMRS
jgi:hypothetical protein